MSDKPKHRFCSQELLGDLQEALSLPLHVQGFLPTASGGYKAFGLAAGLWDKAKTKTMAPFVADTAPTPNDTGIQLFEFPQARFHVNFVGAAVGVATITVWHRNHAYGDTSTSGHWTRGQVYVNIDNLEEVLDPYLWHSEIFFQVTAAVAAGATAVEVFVQGVQDMTAGADVNVVVPPISVAIDSLAKVPPDNILAVGTEDGLPAGTKHVLRTDGQGNQIISPDNSYDCVTVALSPAALVPTEILSGGLSIAGRDLAVVFTDGTFDLRLNAAASPAIPQSPTDHGSWDNTVFTKIFMSYANQPGKTAVLYVGKRV